MPLPIENLINLVVSVLPSCHQIPFLATLYSCLSDRKPFSENHFVCQYKLYRHLATLCPFVLSVFSLLSLFLLKAFMTIRPIVSLDTTFLKRNGTKLPFVKKVYDLLQKKGSLGQVLAIACFHAFGFCFPVVFCTVEGSRTEAILSLLSSLSLSLPDILTLGGVEMGEIGLDAAVAGEIGVPVIFVASDDKGVAEAREIMPWVETVATKQGFGWNAALRKHPKRVEREIYEAVKRAVSRLSEMRPFKLPKPIHVQIRYKRLKDAERATRGITVWRRIDPYTVEATFERITDWL
ncbi:MAG: M55 family metallopeptidase [Armatimonadota bacterium]|nr:M55 family metallopeptidase [Armatimonadota bacterium]